MWLFRDLELLCLEEELGIMAKKERPPNGLTAVVYMLALQARACTYFIK